MTTTYMVFRDRSDDDGPGLYEHVNNVDANNAEQARRKVAEQLDETGFRLFAVPARNWQGGPPVEAETMRRIRSA